MADDTGRDERVARNELAFRQANESLRTVFEGASLEEQSGNDGYPFLCECGERLCTDVVAISLEDYARVRSQPTHFVILPGHKQLDSERILESHEGYEVIEKSGVAGEIARTAWVQLSPSL